MKGTRNVVIFERLWLGSIVIGVVLAVFGPQQSNPFLSDSMMLLLQVVSVASNLWLVLLVSRKNSNASRYLLLISFVGGAAFDLPDVLGMTRPLGQSLLTIVQYGMQLSGLYYLFLTKNSSAYRQGSFVSSDKGIESEINESGRSVLLDCALNLLESNRYDEAIVLFDDVIRSNPGNVDAYCGRGLCFMRLGQTEKGLSDIQRAAINGSVPAQELLRQQ
ncbi:tetratricopeptide repeat protein [Desulfovibrio sp. TomC]|uniref:tetratricopeptide repeat protein n=1 Tax=Desulfovibrio sp. TomC TaxID=1562888 RepID=UPI0005BDC1A0|nr:tetratricopeptide repeat protein [Desulfovibrio sp. TomC]